MQTINKAKDSTEVAIDTLMSYIAESVSEAPNLQLPSPSLREFYKNEQERTLWITEDIKCSSLDIVKAIMKYNLSDTNIPVDQRKPIKIFIDTNGGSVAVMWSIVNAIKMSKTPVYTINFCEALSAGAHILAAGHKRFGMPGSTILIHSGSCMYVGTQEQADSAKKYYDALGKKADEQLLKDTKIQKNVMKRKAPGDWYLDTDAALENGLIDKVIESFDELV